MFLKKRKSVCVFTISVILMLLRQLYFMERETTPIVTRITDPGKPSFEDIRSNYDSNMYEADDIPTKIISTSPSTAPTTAVFSGTYISCTGSNTTCRGLKATCEGTNLVHHVEEGVYKGDNLTCRGDNVTCTGQEMVCRSKGQPGGGLYYKTLPTFYRDVTPDPRQYNIYLIETSSASHLRARILCALESYCKLNPRAVVWLLLTANQLDNITTCQLKALNVSYQNLEVAALNITLALKSTPLERLYNSEKFRRTKYLTENLSDCLRSAIVYKSGGFYSDTDIIAWKTVTNMTNVIGKQGNKYVNGAAFHFMRGHPFLLVEMEDVATNYNGNKWGQQGPRAMTRVLNKHSCMAADSGRQMQTEYLIPPDSATVAARGSSGTKGEHKESNNSAEDGKRIRSTDQSSNLLSICDLTILSKPSFYPVNWRNRNMLFSPWSILKSGSINKVFPNSFGIHLNNHLTGDRDITEQSMLNSMFTLVCPIIQSPNM